VTRDLGPRPAEGVRRHEAVRGIDFEVAAGEVFGLLGRTDAGKTTTVEILEGYRKRDAGDVSVARFDPGRAQRPFREANRRRAAAVRASGRD
jgi:ABC-type multidrug transport system ATPase subunit